jgi:hypothetical protein
MKFDELATRIINENSFDPQTTQTDFQKAILRVKDNYKSSPKGAIFALVGELSRYPAEFQQAGQEMLKREFEENSELVDKALAQHAKDKAMAKGGGDVVGPTLKRTSYDQDTLRHHHNA